MRMPCATSCATMRWSTWALMMRCWSSTVSRTADDPGDHPPANGFLKQGKASCGVGRQYTGSAGKVTNCQIGVFAAYVSVRGRAFVDRALYLPKSWTADPARLAAAHVPAGTAFATKPALAVKMIERAIAAGMPFARARGGCGLRRRRHRAGAAPCRQRLCAGRKG